MTADSRMSATITGWRVKATRFQAAKDRPKRPMTRFAEPLPESELIKEPEPVSADNAGSIHPTDEPCQELIREGLNILELKRRQPTPLSITSMAAQVVLSQF